MPQSKAVPIEKVTYLEKVNTGYTSAPGEEIKARRTKEIVLAFCGAVGSGVSTVAKEFSDVCNNNYNYKVQYIKISDLIVKYAPRYLPSWKTSDLEKPASRIHALQNGGDILRQKLGCDILAQLVIKEIAVERQKEAKNRIPEETKGPIKSVDRIAYIVDSLKHPDEVELLRIVYGNMFYLFGILCAFPIRQFRLQKEKHIEPQEAIAIMERDASEEEIYGQQLNKTLQHSDFFIRNNHENVRNLNESISRFMELLLGNPTITPTKHEYAMYMAQSAALRSGCLSRQVGAAILSRDGEIISTGCNDVPKRGGGLYSLEDGKNDLRCVNRYGGKCYNDEHKRLLKEDIQEILVEELKDNKVIAERIANRISKETRIKDLMEFSRSVHAEMDAIISASRNRNGPLKGSALYSTTFPCHNCARHIIASGLKHVYYIEPFEKSLAIELHDDSIVLEPSEPEFMSERVTFLHFEGVAPRQYLNLFHASEKRKEDGKLILQRIFI